MIASPHFGIVTLVAAQPAWLALPREQRAEYEGSLAAILLRAQPAVRVRFFDAEAFARGHTDWMLAETSDLGAYHDMWEEIRDTPLFTVPYWTVVDTVIGIEDAHQDYDRKALDLAGN